jgi:hypothetical protein
VQPGEPRTAGAMAREKRTRTALRELGRQRKDGALVAANVGMSDAVRYSGWKNSTWFADARMRAPRCVLRKAPRRRNTMLGCSLADRRARRIH